MPEATLLPGLVIAMVVAAAGLALLILRRPLTTTLQISNHQRQLMDPAIVAALVMLVGIAALTLGALSAGYFVLRLLGLFTPLAV